MRGSPRAALALAAVVFATAASIAAEIHVRPGDSLPSVLGSARPGDVVHLEAGRYAGPLLVDKPVSLIGEAGASIVGLGQGSVITITAPDVTIEGLEISGSGRDVPAMDSAVLAERTALRARIVSNRLTSNLFGVYLHGAAGSVVARNIIVGRSDLRTAEAGNGVSIWNAPDAVVTGNDISRGRDGIFVNTSKRNIFSDNRFSGLRFAIHYMYTNDSKVTGNRSRGNHVGFAIMYSNNLEIRDNVSEGDRDHGLMLNSANGSKITGNSVAGGGGKCVFIYNANKNLFADNRFEGCPIGIHFTAGSERNTITGNAFIGNRTQVKYVGTRYLDWAKDGRGNFWSDNPAFDLDGDGISDRPYRPNDVMDEVLWQLPSAKALANSPAVQAIRWAQARFPALYPGGVVDSAPLMQPPPAREKKS